VNVESAVADHDRHEDKAGNNFLNEEDEKRQAYSGPKAPWQRFSFTDIS
jgi:hypothetical protein